MVLLIIINAIVEILFTTGFAHELNMFSDQGTSFITGWFRTQTYRTYRVYTYCDIRSVGISKKKTKTTNY